MTNPFPAGPPVRGGDFCGREPELTRVQRLLRDRGVAWVAGEPGSGVTSLGLEVAERSRRRTARLDLWCVPGPRSLVRSLAEVLGAREPSPSRGPVGRPSEAGPSSGDPEGPEGDGLQRTVRRLVAGRASEAPLLLIVDGAERLAEEELRPALAGLRRAAAPGSGARGADGGDAPAPGAPESSGPGGGSRTALLFTGHLPRRLRELAGDDPFLRLGSIPYEAWLPFTLERFLETDRWIANEDVEAAVRFTGGHPRYTHQLLHLLWAGCDPGGRVTGETLAAAKEQLLGREGTGFQAAFRLLTPNQRRVLRGLALEDDPRPFSARFVARHGLASPSSVQRALEALVDAGLVRRDADGGPRIRDPLLGRWLRWRCRTSLDVAGPPS